jgi:hypothetical protein
LFGKVAAIYHSDFQIKAIFLLSSALTGLNKAETAEKHGEEQVQIWRRSYDVPPPPMEEDHPYYDIIVKDER